MFNWWMPRAAEGSREGSGVHFPRFNQLTNPASNTEIEPPETPAPLFAARAIRSAIFGTPTPVDEQTLLEIEKTEPQGEARPGRSAKESQSGSISPTKLPGILLTPGTATSRRKTVSFGCEVLEKSQQNASENATTKDVIETVHSPGKSKVAYSSKPTHLARVLENARGGRSWLASSEKSRRICESQPLIDLPPTTEDNNSNQLMVGRRTSKFLKTSEDRREDCVLAGLIDGDMTVDLNQPHSQSGKYWKSEFEQYHDEARAEMKKLTKYKILAKSYAKKKDAEALDLAAKLKAEQKHVTIMKDRVSKLSAQVVAGDSEGGEDNSPRLVEELARQTALAVQYRAQVEDFRAALEGVNRRTDVGCGEEPITSTHEVHALLHTQQELKRVREQLERRDAIHNEIRDLKKRLSAAEDSTRKLQEENAKLTQELLYADQRLEREIEQSEKRKMVSQERLQKRDEALQALQKDYDLLKELAKSQRRDAERLMNKRNAQVVELRRDLASTRGAESTSKDLHQVLEEKNAELGKILPDYQRQIVRLIDTQSKDAETVALPTKGVPTEATPPASMIPNNDCANLQKSQIPVASSPVPRLLSTIITPKKSLVENDPQPHELPRPRSSQSALVEITNRASSERQTPHASSSVQYLPPTNCLSNLSMDAPDRPLPSLESSTLSQSLGREIHDRKLSNKPSSINGCPSVQSIPANFDANSIFHGLRSRKIFYKRCKSFKPTP